MVLHVFVGIGRKGSVFVHFLVKMLLVEDGIGDSGVQVHESLGDDKSSKNDDKDGQSFVSFTAFLVDLPVS